MKILDIESERPQWARGWGRRRTKALASHRGRGEKTSRHRATKTLWRPDSKDCARGVRILPGTLGLIPNSTKKLQHSCHVPAPGLPDRGSLVQRPDRQIQPRDKSVRDQIGIEAAASRLNEWTEGLEVHGHEHPIRARAPASMGNAWGFPNVCKA